MTSEFFIYLEKSGELLQKVLSKKHPLKDSGYKALLDEFNNAQDFQDVFTKYIQSLGLKIISSTNEMILMPSDASSPYYQGYKEYSNKLARLKGDESIDKKAILLLIHLAIIASFYPSKEVVLKEFELSKSIKISDISQMLINKAEFLLSEFPNNEQLCQLAKKISQMPIKNDNENRQKEKLDISFLNEFIKIVLNHLEEEKFVKKESFVANEDEYVILNKFKQTIKYYLDDVLFNKFIEFKGRENV